MSVTWGSLDTHLQAGADAWELAKKKLGVADVRDLSTEQFRDVIALATEIRKGTANVEKL